MAKQQIIFVGGIGSPGQFGGELSKNKLIISRLEELGYEVVCVDTAGASRNPLKLLRLPMVLLRLPADTPMIFSTCFANIRMMLRILRRLYPGRTVTYWAIGGRIPQFIRDGRYSVNDFSYPAHILVEGHRMVNEMEAMGITGLRYVPNFKRLTSLPYTTGKRIAPDETLRCVFLSRIIPEKGVRNILDACRKLSDRNFTVDFYGEIAPEFRTEFNAAIEALPNAAYRGTLDFFNPSGLQTLSTYHLSLFPTYWIGEGFPGVVIDSMAASVPILASDWNFNREVVNQQCGFIYPGGDDGNPEAFTAALRHILDDRTCLNPMFAVCQSEARRFDVERIITPGLAASLLNPLP